MRLDAYTLFCSSLKEIVLNSFKRVLIFLYTGMGCEAPIGISIVFFSRPRTNYRADDVHPTAARAHDQFYI